MPDKKRRDLQRVVEVLFAEFAEAIGIATAKWKKQGRILKVALYGSYARGGWVEDPVCGYFSDYDILVVVKDERLTDAVEHWAKADDHLTRAYTVAPVAVASELSLVTVAVCASTASARFRSPPSGPGSSGRRLFH